MSTAFITNLFEGIDTLDFHEVTSAITHITSRENEKVQLIREVRTHGLQADSWLKGLENSLTLSVKDAVFKAFAYMN